MQSLCLPVQCLAELAAVASLTVRVAIVGAITIYLFLLLVQGHVLLTVLDFTIKKQILLHANLAIQIAINAIKRVESNAYRVRLPIICMSWIINVMPIVLLVFINTV